MPREPRPVPSGAENVDGFVALGWSARSVRRAARRGELQRLLPGTYASAADERALLTAARSHFGPDVVAVLDTAAALHGLPTPWPRSSEIHVALPPGREQRQRSSFCFHTWKLRDDEVCVVDGHRVTTLDRTLADLVCLRDPLSATAALDSVLHDRRLTDRDLLVLQASTVRRRGAARGRGLWTAPDGRAASPLESRVRFRAVAGGYRPHELQRRFDLDPGVAYVDLAWRMRDGRWLGLEADGADWHSAPSALYVDRARGNALHGRGDVVLLRTTWPDTVRPDVIPRLLGRFLDP